ncbi:hypothetical protein H9L39_14800 [Fusarium oxysporum f. sp. albedinis]|nr:hypothetical protein H9L39_14800 [Fusarium oxysporum f. sp. albedinis]
MQPGVTELPLKRGSRALGLEPVDARCNPEALLTLPNYQKEYRYAIVPTFGRQMSHIEAHMNSVPYMDGVTMLDGDTPEVNIGDDLTVYDPTVTFYPQWELSESVNPPAFLGAFQNEVDITTLSRQDYLPQGQFLFYGESSSGDRWVDTYSTVKNQTLLSERLVTVNDEPPSALTPSLQLSQEPPKKPGLKSNRQLSGEFPSMSLLITPDSLYTTHLISLSFSVSRCARRLSPEAAEKLSSHFVSIRRQIHDAEIEANIRSSIPITIRQLEAIVRITESLAKLTLSPVATEANVDEAIRLFLCSTMDAANQGSNQGSRELNNEVNRLETELKRRLLI